MATDVHSERLAPNGPRPLYEQLADIFRRRIASGLWPVHHKLLAEPELARAFKVARGTVRVAIGQLVKDGLLVQVQGKGTFVRGSERRARNPYLSFAELLERAGVSYRTSVLSFERADDDPRVADILGAGPFVVLRRVRSLREGPVSLMENVLAARVCPGLTADQLEDGSLYRLLESRFGLQIGGASRTFSSLAADADLAEHLDLPVGAPVLEISQVTHLRDGRPFEFAQFWIRTDRHKLVADFQRDFGES
ncbi:MAG: GntR family transcriptional regulator [Rhizobiales bacterium]|nr:GntR family transcriptional regulator [Hyphomicrobiales bacterium]